MPCALGVPELDAVDNEQAIAGAERALFRDGILRTAGPGALYLDYFLATDGRPGPGAVYVLHFLEPIGNPANRRAMARHYIGWSPDPPKRIARHTAGQGAAIVRAVQAWGDRVHGGGRLAGGPAAGAQAQAPP